MAKVSLSEHMLEDRPDAEDKAAQAGPFVTISRQFGCYGFSLGLLLREILNEELLDDRIWKIYHKEILAQLATETNLATELLDRQRRAKPKFIVDFFRSISGGGVPSSHEIRNRITTIIRGLAIEGRAIIIGQGSTGACHDLSGGISVRLEGPEDWRVKQVAFREGLGHTQAKLRIRSMEEQRQYLRKIYETKYPRKPAFNLVYDCSVFSLTQIARQIVLAMKMKHLV